MIRKLNDYQQMGVEQIWLVDPADPVWMCFEDGSLVERETFNIHGRQINFKMTEIHRRLR